MTLILLKQLMTYTNYTFPSFRKSLIFISLCLIHTPLYSQELPAVDCVITPHKVIDLASPVPGVLDTILVERSDQVFKGQIVAKLAAGVETATVALAKLRADIQSEIKARQVNLAFDKRNKDRIDVLYQKQAVSFNQIDEAERALKLSTLELKQARKISQIRTLEVHQAEEQLKQKIITSPVDGFIIQTFKSKGEYVEDQAILQIAQLDPVSVEAILPIDTYGQIKVGMVAEIVSEYFSAKRLKGQVTVVDRVGDAASGTYGIRLTLPNPDYSILTGLKCELKFYDEPETASLASANVK